LRARRVNELRRMRGGAAHTGFVGALVAIVTWNIGNIDCVLRVPRTIALHCATVARNLRRRRRSVWGEGDAAAICDARTRSAECVGARTGTRRDALHASACTVADSTAHLSARTAGRKRRIRRNTQGTAVERTLLTVIRRIRIVGCGNNVASAIALILLTVAGGLCSDGGACSSVRYTAHIRNAGSYTADRIGARTCACAHALNASARAIANGAAGLIAGAAYGQWRIRWCSCSADIVCAHLAVIRQICSVDHGHNRASPIALIFHAVPGGLPCDRRTQRSV
jgi:hypothetical protein